MPIEMSRNPNVQIGGAVVQRRTVTSDMIAPAQVDVEYEVAPDKAAEPIKKMSDILRVSRFLISKKRYRDNMLFIVGINFGLRVSDLRELRFCNVINDNLTFKDTFAVFERKTRNTRKRKKNRYITINNAVCDAVKLYLEHTPDVCLSDYMFRSESNRGHSAGKPLTNMSVDRILKGIAKDCGLTMKVSTHTLRKTFAYHQMVMSGNDPRKLLLLQKMLNHSTAAQTLEYIGITGEEIHEAYMSLNLGSELESYLVDGMICEMDADAG